MKNVPNPLIRQATVYNDQAIRYWQQGKHQEALGLWEDAIDKAPEAAEIHHNLGSAYLYLNRIDEAYQSLQRAINHNPELVEAYAQIGNIYHRQGDVPTAAEYWNLALQIDPTYREAIVKLEQLNTTQYDLENIPEYGYSDEDLPLSNVPTSHTISPNNQPLTLGQKLSRGISKIFGAKD